MDNESHRENGGFCFLFQISFGAFGISSLGSIGSVSVTLRYICACVRRLQRHAGTYIHRSFHRSSWAVDHISAVWMEKIGEEVSVNNLGNKLKDNTIVNTI